MERSLSDAELLQASVSNPRAFEELFDRHSMAVRRYVMRRVGPSDGEDLAAEAFARAFRSRGRFRAEYETALPWLLGVANRVVSEHRRLERRRLATLERLMGEGVEVVAAPEVGLTVELVRALRRLPSVDRDTLLLLVWGELSREETAAALGVPVGTVSSRVARARRRLASDLELGGAAASTELRLNGEGNV